jgi:2,3-bisphosphoglycerate-independent phosphoglycerate mutase
MTTKHPTLLCILDGWGQSDSSTHNAIADARTPVVDAMMAHDPNGLIYASEHFVGLPKGQMGNSEVGHMNIGSGRPVRQLLPRINEALSDNTLKDSPELSAYIAKLKESGGACHLFGLCSDGGVHAHLTHITALANIIASHGIKVWIHAITDGRDTAPKSALENGFIAQLVALTEAEPLIRIATLSGRYYGMDRDHKWERVERAYAAFTQGIGFEAKDALAALKDAYARGEEDEFIQPTVIAGYENMSANDGVLMANFRPDRARQLMQAFTAPTFDGFERSVTFPIALGMADYWSEDCPLTIPAIFPMEQVEESLGAVLAREGKTQLRAAETEKFNHVTFFFSGGNGTFEGEDRLLIPSPDVATYDLQPEMSAHELTDKLVEAIASGKYDFIVVNYANPDMVGHTGKHDKVVEAIEVVDTCLGRVRDAIDAAGGTLLVTADHGNAELTMDENGNPHTQHTTNRVPFIVHGRGKDSIAIRDGGALSDIAPTILSLMGIAKPQAMTGESLVTMREAIKEYHDTVISSASRETEMELDDDEMGCPCHPRR